jgi:uncharacterized membrane protein YsdA (DUF1294 family)
MGETAGWGRRHPIWASLGLVLGITAALTVLLWYYASGAWSIVPWLLCWFAILNPITFLTYAWDKRQAGKDGRRVPEFTLFTIAFLGGSLSAFVAMRVLRHKTIKMSFVIVFWLIVVAQVLLLIWFVKEKWFSNQ